MDRRYTKVVDVKFPWFVGVPAKECANLADHLPVHNGNTHQVIMVFQEIRQIFRIDCVIENLGGDIFEDLRVGTVNPDDSDFHEFELALA